MDTYRSELQAALARVDALSRGQVSCASCAARRERRERLLAALVRTAAHFASAALALTMLFAFVLTGGALLVASCALGSGSPPCHDLGCIAVTVDGRTAVPACGAALATAAIGCVARAVFVRLERWLALDPGR